MVLLLAETLLEKAMENGVIPVRFEDDVCRFRIGHLYAKPASALRELYANELRACHITRDQYGASPRIEITVNIPERTIAIHGIGSLGISEEKFLNVLSVLGENDNQDGSEVGQFGWGVSSYLSVSSSILFETFARETGEKFAMVGINGDHFNKVSQPSLRTTGTRVTVFIKDELNVEQLGNEFHRVCAYADIPTYLKFIGKSEVSQESHIEMMCTNFKSTIQT
jgi:HSP90 family molecular chaperone